MHAAPRMLYSCFTHALLVFYGALLKLAFVFPFCPCLSHASLMLYSALLMLPASQAPSRPLGRLDSEKAHLREGAIMLPASQAPGRPLGRLRIA